MFEDVTTADLLGHLRAFDFDDLPAHEHGHTRIEAIKSLDRAVRAAQAEQIGQIIELHRERAAQAPP